MDIYVTVTDSFLCEELHKSSHFNATHHAKLYPQHGGRIVTVDSVTSLHPCYTASVLFYVEVMYDCVGVQRMATTSTDDIVCVLEVCTGMEFQSNPARSRTLYVHPHPLAYTL